MKKIDKLIMGIMSKEGDPNPYIDKSDWSWFDYLIGYGCPLGIFCFAVLMLVEGLSG